MSQPKDKALYEKCKKKLSHLKPSAYRSGLLVKTYKEEYAKKYGNTDAYIGKNSNGLTRWFAEDWKNQRGEVGYKYKSDVYRPTKRVSKETPLTFSELSNQEIEKARKTKAKTGRVNRFRK